MVVYSRRLCDDRLHPTAFLSNHDQAQLVRLDLHFIWSYDGRQTRRADQTRLERRPS
jgi:hypothetical protein